LLAGFVAFELKVMPSGSVEANRRVAEDDIRLTGKRLVERARVEAIMSVLIRSRYGVLRRYVINYDDVTTCSTSMEEEVSI
jgi:hypothetical protein